jgi:hypothetical protein
MKICPFIFCHESAATENAQSGSRISILDEEIGDASIFERIGSYWSSISLWRLVSYFRLV